MVLALIKESIRNLGNDNILNDTFTYYSQVSWPLPTVPALLRWVNQNFLYKRNVNDNKE